MRPSCLVNPEVHCAEISQDFLEGARILQSKCDSLIGRFFAVYCETASLTFSLRQEFFDEHALS